jgi:hypothetical protein
MEKGTIIKGEQKDTSICDLYDKLEEMKAKLGFLTESVIGILEKTDYGEDFKDKMIRGFDLLMGSLENEFKNVETILDTLLDKQRLFESLEARIRMAGQGAWNTKEAAIINLNKDIDGVKAFLDYINEFKERAEDLLKRGEKLLQRYQTA